MGDCGGSCCWGAGICMEFVGAPLTLALMLLLWPLLEIGLFAALLLNVSVS